MRIGCLQFAPQVGDIDNNLNRADAVLNRKDPDALDLLVLPELAFSGYNFKSLQEISPYLEPSGSGITSLWTRTVALKYDCTVITGYPEKVDPSLKWPTDPEYYNAAIVVNDEGETIANYRKDHLYATDEKWALEGSRGFFQGFIPGLGPTCIGICTDLNPYQGRAPWHKFEFAHHVLDSEARIVVIPMAWTTQEEARSFSRMPQEPDMVTLTYWISRLEPVIRNESDEEIIVIFANRTGTEDGVTYAGTSAVVGIKSGEVYLYGVLGRGDKDLLVVDTEAPPYAKLAYRPSKQSSAESKMKGAATDIRENPRDTNSLDVTAQGTTSKDPAPKTNTKPGRTYQRASSPSYRRKDLFITTTAEKSDSLESVFPFVHTPTAPTPTPHSIRPRLPMPPAPSMTQRYLEATLPISPTQIQAARVPGFILGGEVKFEALYPQSATSATFASESHFSESSIDSPKLNPAINWERLWPSSTFRSPDHSPAEPSRLEYESKEEQKRLSIRSDVSVWNNHQGRRRSVAMLADPSEQHIDAVREASADVSSSAETGQAISTGKSEFSPLRPSSPKSRHASRSRGGERSSSSIRLSSHIASVQGRLEDTKTRANSARSFRPTSTFDSRAQLQYGFRGEADEEEYARVRTQSKTPARTVSRMSIPIAMDLSIWESLNKEAAISSNPSTRQSSELPVLKPFLREKIGFMSDSNRASDSRIGRRSSTSEAILTEREFHGTDEDEPGSRGRQKSTRLSPPGAQSYHAHPTDRMRGSTINDVIDLSKFAMIEEYPSAHCPVHGQQSRSTMRDGDSQTSIQPQQRHHSLSPKDVPAASSFSHLANGRTALNEHQLSSDCVSEHQMQGTHSPSGSCSITHQEPKTPKAMKIQAEDYSTEDVGDGVIDPPREEQLTEFEGSFLSRRRSCVW
jgi:predicted amidohydrolase